MRGKKWMVVSVLVLIFFIFYKKIFLELWLLENRNRVFYGSVTGDESRLYHNKKDEFGIVPDIFEEVRERYGINIRCTRGEGDFIATSALFEEEEKEKFYFTESYLDIGLYLYTKEKMNSFKEVKNMRIISRDLEERLIQNLGLEENRRLPTLKEQIEEYKKGGYHGLILDGEATKEVEVKNLLEGMHKTLIPATYDIKVRMKIPKDRGYLFDILKSTLKELESSGELRRIVMSNSIRVERKNLRFTPEEEEWLKRKEKLRVRGSEDLKLLTMPGALSYREGAASFFISGFSKLIGVPVEIVQKDYDFTLDEVGEGRSDYRYTNPLYQYNIVVYSQNMKSIKTLTNLEGKRIGALKGIREEKYLKENIELGQVVAFESFKDMISALEGREIDYFVMREDLADFYLQSNNLKDIHRVGTLKKITTSIGVPEENKELYSILSKALSLRKSTIEMEKMRKQIQASPVLLEVRLRTLFFWTGGGILTLLYLAFSITQVRKKNRYLQEKNLELEKNEFLVLAIIGVLEKSNEYNDEDTGEHIVRVGLYSKLLAELSHCSDVFISEIGRFASLHDVGKVAISDSILKKRGKLTNEEFEAMKKHVTRGYELIHDAQLGSVAENIVRYHHERWNGRGYMEGLQGEEIPFEARIVALVDVYDALRQERSYKPAFSHEKSVVIIQEERGKHFDPQLVDIFLANHKKFERIYSAHQ